VLIAIYRAAFSTHRIHNAAHILYCSLVVMLCNNITELYCWLITPSCQLFGCIAYCGKSVSAGIQTNFITAGTLHLGHTWGIRTQTGDAVGIGVYALYYRKRTGISGI